MISRDVGVRVSVHKGGVPIACPFLGGQPGELRGEVFSANYKQYIDKPFTAPPVCTQSI